MLKQLRYVLMMVFAIALQLLTFPSYAQTLYKVEGTVVTADNRPADGITVRAAGTPYATATRNDGSYEFRLKPGRYTLRFSSVGAVLVEKQIIVQDNSMTVPLVALQPTLQQLNEVVLEGKKVNKFARTSSTTAACLPLTSLENPQVYSVLSKELIQELQLTTTEDALRNMPGLNNVVASPGGGGVSVGYVTRGVPSSSVIFRNGMQSSMVSLSDPVNVDHFESIKGPSATLFGAGRTSYGGLVNVVTKKPNETLRGELGYTTGSNALSRFTADINLPMNDERTALFRLNGAYQTNTLVQGQGRRTSMAIAPSFSYKVSDRLMTYLDIDYVSNTMPLPLYNIRGVQAANFKDLNIDPRRSYTGSDIVGKMQNFVAYLRADYDIGSGWTSQTLYTHARGINNTNYVFLNFLKGGKIQRNIYMIPVSDMQTAEFQQNFTNDTKWGSTRNRLLVGFDFTHEYANTQRQSVDVDTISLTSPASAQPALPLTKVMGLAAKARSSNYAFTSNTYGGYITDVFNVTESLLLMGGLRLDKFVDPSPNGYKQVAYSPKFGAVYQIVPKQVSVFANYLNGFKNISGQDDAGNKYKPQQAYQLEGGVKFETLGSRLNANISYYDIKVKDVLRTVPGFVNQVQDGEVHSNGFEADITANPIEGLNLVAGYAYNEIKYTKAAAAIEGKRPQGTPAHTSNVWVSYRIAQGPLKNAGLGAGGNWQSKCFTNDMNTMVFDGYAIANASLFYEMPKLRVGLKVDNIADKKYWVFSYYPTPQNGRTFSLNLTYRFR